MTGTKRQSAAALLLLALLAGCVAPAAERAAPAGPAQARPRGSDGAGLDAVMGRDARALVARFGNPDLDVREGRGRKLQFVGPACVLDAYLYAPRTGAEPVVTHIDARLPDGRDMDRASCIAALGRRVQAR